MKKINLHSIWSLALAAFLLGLPASAADLGETVQLHGFGGWAYGQTDGNHYLTGSDDGDYSHADFFLNIHSQPSERLAIFAQVGWSQDESDSEVVFDYAFAEWNFSDAARARIGRIKHPWGIYGETLRVGTLRPFLTLPQGVYGPQGFVGNGYNGVGLTGRFFMDSGWTVGYDLYGGQLRADFEAPNLFLFGANPDPSLMNDGVTEVELEVDDVVGGRLDFGTPLAGLRFGASAYLGSTDDNLTGRGSRTMMGVHLEYLWKGLLIRGEYMNQAQDRDDAPQFNTEFDAAYLEAAWTLKDRWQFAARYDWAELGFTSFDVSMLPKYHNSYLEHEDLSLGVNYWFNNHFAVKLSYHMVEGIRFSNPVFDNPLAVLLQDDFNHETDLVQFGGQFSF